MIPVSFTVDKLTCAWTGTNWSSGIQMAVPSCLRKEAGNISRPVGLLSVSHPYQLSDHIIEMIDAL